MNVSLAARHRGFSLIELVAVMVLLGVLAAFVLPRFSSTSDFSAYSAQDQIIAAARMAQQRSMIDRQGGCYGLVISANRISVQEDGVNIGPSESWRNGITVDANVVISDQSVFFDGLGNAISACGGAQNATVVTISIAGPVTLNVCVNAVGYIYAC